MRHVYCMFVSEKGCDHLKQSHLSLQDGPTYAQGARCGKRCAACSPMKIDAASAGKRGVEFCPL